ncbi:uncharacterized protein ACMZJ9_014711 [Mantella aurantiaca]
MSTTTTQVGNLRITTQVVNAADASGLDVPQPNTTLMPAPSKYFKKIPVKALSAVLILVGILQLSIGLTFYAAETTIVSLTLKSGVYIWGGLAVIVAGVTSLTAILRDTINMVKVCMSCNIANIVVAAIGLILFSIQIRYESQACWLNLQDEDQSTCPYERNSYSYYFVYSDMTVKLRVSMNIIVILFSLLGLVISCFMTAVCDKVLKTTGYSLLR